jgi:hypothetical protein
MIFPPIFAIFCSGKGEHPLVLEQPSGLCQLNWTSTIPAWSSSMYQLTVPSTPLLHPRDHDIPRIFVIFCSGRGEHPLVLEPPGPCPCNRTSTTFIWPSMMYQSAILSTPLLHPSHHDIPVNFRYFLVWQGGTYCCTRMTVQHIVIYIGSF